MPDVWRLCLHALLYVPWQQDVCVQELLHGLLQSPQVHCMQRERPSTVSQLLSLSACTPFSLSALLLLTHCLPCKGLYQKKNNIKRQLHFFCSPLVGLLINVFKKACESIWFFIYFYLISQWVCNDLLNRSFNTPQQQSFPGCSQIACVQFHYNAVIE